MKDDSDLSDSTDRESSESESSPLHSLIGGLDLVRIVVLVGIIVAMILLAL